MKIHTPHFLFNGALSGTCYKCYFWVFNLTKFDPPLNKLHNQTDTNSLNIDLGTVML